MLYLYLPSERSMYSDEIGEYISYGITVTDNSGNTVTEVLDISVEKEPISDLCRLCTEEKLDPIHLQDVIEDFI